MRSVCVPKKSAPALAFRRSDDAMFDPHGVNEVCLQMGVCLQERSPHDPSLPDHLEPFYRIQILLND